MNNIDVAVVVIVGTGPTKRVCWHLRRRQAKQYIKGVNTLLAR